MSPLRWIGTACVFVAFLVLRVQSLGISGTAVFLLFGAVAPFLISHSAKSGFGLRARLVFAVLVSGVCVLGLGFDSRVGFALWTALVLVQVLGYCLPLESKLARVGSMVVPPTYFALEMVTGPNGLLSVGFVVTFATSLVLANRIVGETTGRVRGETQAAVEPRMYVMVYGAIAALAIVVALPFLSLPFLALPAPRLHSNVDSTDTRDPRTANEGRSGVESRARGQGNSLDKRFPDSLALAGRVTRLRHELVAEIAAREVGDTDPGYVGPLYLRGLVLDRIDRDRVRASGSRARHVLDADDGSEDGVCLFDDPDDYDAGTLYELAVRAQALRETSTGRAILFLPTPLVALAEAEAYFDPDGALFLDDGTDEEWIETSAIVGALPIPPDVTLPSSVDERWLQRPDAPVLARLEREAHRVTKGKSTPLARIKALIEHYQGFEYNLEATSLKGVDGLDEFLDAERGYCAYFAVATVLQLRYLGIPARLATGFLGQTYDPKTQRYQVSSRDGHVWFEVLFEDVGWVAFDSTPSAARDEALRLRDRGELGSVDDWASAIFEDFVGWFAAPSNRSLERLKDSLVNGPGGALGLVAMLLGLVALVLGGRWLVKRRADSPEVVVAMSSTSARPHGCLARWLACLGNAGVRPQASETPRRLAERAGRVRGALDDGWFLDRAYAERFGAHALTDAEARRAENWLDELESRLGPELKEGSTAGSRPTPS